jgi:hypothetical protein
MICAFFSFTDAGHSSTAQCNIGSASVPKIVTLNAYGRAGLNSLIGECFGQYLTYFDDLIGRIVAQEIPHVSRRKEREIPSNPLFDTLNEGTAYTKISIGTNDCSPADEAQVLGP